MLRAFVFFAMLSIPSRLFADSASVQLVIGVTVARSSVINTQPAESSSHVSIVCAKGACEALRVSSSTSQSDLRVVTINF